MKKLICTVVLLTVCTGSGKAGSLAIVVNSWPPYVEKQLPGKGLAMQIVANALQRKGYQSIITIETWSRVLEGLEVGVFDIVGAIWKTPEREKTLLFSKPYLVNRIKFIRHKNLQVEYQSLQDLSGYLIGVVKDYAYDEDFLKSELIIKIQQNHIIQNLLKLEQGEIDLTLGDERALSFELNRYMHGQAGNFKFLDKPLSTQGLHIAVSRQHPAGKQIITAFNQAIQEMQADGSLDRIVKQYDRK